MFLPPRLRFVLAASVTAFALIALCSHARGEPQQAKPAASEPAGPVEQAVPIETVIAKMQKIAADHPGQPMHGRFVDQLVTGSGHTDTFDGTSKGPSLEAKGEHKAPASFTGAPGEVHPPGGGGASTGGFDGKAAPENETGSRWWASGWFWAGIACWLIAAAVVVVPMLWPAMIPARLSIGVRVPIGFFLAGAGCFVAAFFPGLAAIGGIAALVCLAGPKLKSELDRLRQVAATQKEADIAQAEHDVASSHAADLKSALHTMVSGVALLPAIVKAQATNAIAGQVDATRPDRDLIHEAADEQGVELRIPENPVAA